MALIYIFLKTLACILCGEVDSYFSELPETAGYIYKAITEFICDILGPQ